IVLRGSRGPMTEERLNKVLQPTLPSLLRGGEFPYPVSLLYFTMTDDQGYQTWLAEPVLTPDGKPRLQVHSAPACRKFDRAALDRVVDGVDGWYDAFFATIVLRAWGRLRFGCRAALSPPAAIIPRPPVDSRRKSVYL